MPDGRFDSRTKLEFLERTEQYVKVRTVVEDDEGEKNEDDPVIEAYVAQACIPDGRFPAGTRVAILETTQSYVKVRAGDGTEGFVEPAFVRKQTPDG